MVNSKGETETLVAVTADFDALIFPVLPSHSPPSVPISLAHTGSAHPVSLCSYFLDLPPSLSEPAATTKRPLLTVASPCSPSC